MMRNLQHGLADRFVRWFSPLVLAFSVHAGAAAETDLVYRYVLEAETEVLRARSDGNPSVEEMVQFSFEVVKLRFQDLDIEPASIAREGEKQIVVELAGPGSRSTIENVFDIGKDVRFFVVVATIDPDKELEVNTKEGTQVLPMADRSAPVLVSKSGGIPGTHLTYANPGIDPWTDEPVITVGFDEVGRRLLAELSTKHVGGRMAVVVEGEVVIAPVLEEPILGGHMQLADNFTAERANEIAIMLRSGALPSPFRIVEERILE